MDFTNSSLINLPGQVPDVSRITANAFGHTAALLDSSSPLALPPVTGIVTQLPGLYVDQDPSFAQHLKFVLERMPVSITGIDVTYTRSATEGPAGNDSQSVPSAGDRKLEQASPAFEFGEYARNLIWETFYQWDNDMGDPNSGVFAQRFKNPGPRVLSRYSVTMAFIQFDHTFLPENIIGGSVVSGMFPLTYGEMGLQKQTESNAPTRSVSFSGVLRHNQYMKNYLIKLATHLKLGELYRNYSGITTNIDVSGVDALRVNPTLEQVMAAQ